VQRLFPDVEDGVSPPEAIDIGVPIEDVEKVMKKMERGTAPGPSGLRVDHLKQVMETTSGQHKDELLGLLAQVIAQAAGGHWETALARWITGGKITPLRKKDGGVRPVVAVETLRSLVSRFVLQSCAGMARDYLPAKQKGFTPGANGMQTAVYTVREWAKRSHEKVILKLDISNAFNTISRRACCEEADNIDIVLGCWARWSLAANPFLTCNGYEISAKTGLVQGEPLSPLLFCAGIKPIIEELSTSVPSLEDLWFLDDGGLEGRPAAVGQGYQFLQNRLPTIGLAINPAKSEVYYDGTEALPPELASLPRVQDKGQRSYLGAPLYSGKSQAMESMVSRLKTVCNAIGRMAAHYPQQAMTLLRTTTGPCRTEHLAQALRPEEWPDGVIGEVKQVILTAAEQIIGSPLTPLARAQVQLPLSKGGLGLTDPEDVLPAARLAMLVQCGDAILDIGNTAESLTAELNYAVRAYAARRGLQKPLVPRPEPHLQHVLMEPIMDQRNATFLATLTGYDNERVLSLQTPHAMSWVDGSNPWISMTPAQYRAALHWVLGLPCVPEGLRCAACGVVCDTLGVHLSKCTLSGAPARGHSVPKDVFAKICKTAGLGVQKEVKLVQRPDLVPSDLRVQGLDPKGDSSLDFTCWSRSAGDVDPLDRAMIHKHQKYGAACSAEGLQYRVWAADTMGGMHPTARALTKQVIRILEDKEVFDQSEQVAPAVWGAMSTAVLLRPAMHIARHTPVPGNVDVEDAEEIIDEDTVEASGVNTLPLPGTSVVPIAVDPCDTTAPATGPAVPSGLEHPAPTMECDPQTATRPQPDTGPIRVLCRPPAGGTPPA
jgi:hypothetical protein